MIVRGDYREIVSALWLCCQSPALNLRRGEYHSVLDTAAQRGLLPAAGREDAPSFARGSALSCLGYCVCAARLGRRVRSEP